MFTFVTYIQLNSLFTMVNVTEFSQRLQKVIDFHDESASSFAEKIGVQRSSISHVLSGRNKPSLDFVMKVLNAYPNVELYWLLNGKGTFPIEKTSPISTQQNSQIHNEHTSNIVNTEKAIEKIVIFYEDGSFKSYKP